MVGEFIIKLPTGVVF